MYGAVLSLLLIGLLRFGMGLLNIQSQVQSTVIGLLLIISIFLPHLGQHLSATKNIRFRWKTLLIVLGVLILIAAFIAFFIWSRTPILEGF
jgi:hypothetical protein